MARYKQKGVIIREFEDLTIVLADKETIWAVPRRSGPNIIFHRWFAPLGSYTQWHRFRKKLDENKNVTLAKCYRWAAQHGIQSLGSTRAPTLHGEPIELKHATTAKSKGGEK